MPSCSSVDCRNRSGAEGVTLFSFPRDEFRRKQLILKMKRNIWKPSDNSLLCSKHFEENQELGIPREGKGLLSHSNIVSISKT
uniref:THAP domaincontaining protein 2like [Acyrthosiphon pisum] n=1 Tax=Lepeophtheirus salmonis TaxID=72036 RepID=A0A0K2VB81_LEPSM